MTSSWLAKESNGHTVAYNEGASGETTNGAVAILDFGRQESTSTGWQVLLTDGTEEPQSWVETVAEDFAAGWQSDHTNSLVMAIGTNNSDYAWSNGSSLWGKAGTDWANVVNTVYNKGYQYISVYGANDIESWNGSFSSGWVATGTDSTDWCQAYNNVSGAQTMIDYGSEALHRRFVRLEPAASIQLCLWISRQHCPSGDLLQRRSDRLANLIPSLSRNFLQRAYLRKRR